MHFRDYTDWEQEANKIREENEALLKGFTTWLTESGLKEKTIKRHGGNVLFFINEFLLYEDAIRPEEGLSFVNDYFNWFFPRKAMWSSVENTKQTVASLKKFYQYLVEVGRIQMDDYQEFIEEVKNQMPEWLEHYRHLEEW